MLSKPGFLILLQFGIGKNNAQVKINIKIADCKDWEAGLMMLLLKDLWASDLPLGGEKNIGRGLLKGETVKICFNGNNYAINEEKNRLRIDGDKQELENLVRSFVEKCSKEGLKYERIKIDWKVKLHISL